MRVYWQRVWMMSEEKDKDRVKVFIGSREENGRELSIRMKGKVDLEDMDDIEVGFVKDLIDGFCKSENSKIERDEKK